MATAKDRMLEAKGLIQAKQYDKARKILQGIDHPTAREWLNKITGTGGTGKTGLKVQLAKVEDDLKSREGQQRSATIVFIGSLILAPVGVGIVLLPFSLINYFRHKRAVKRLQRERLELIAQMG